MMIMVNSEAKPLILIVDDEEDLLEIFRFSFEKSGFSVMTASNISEARKVIADSQLSAILCDHDMPGGSGLELRKAMVDQDEPILFYLMSGKLNGLAIDANLRIAAYFKKPFELNEIVNTIKHDLAVEASRNEYYLKKNL